VREVFGGVYRAVAQRRGIWAWVGWCLLPLSWLFRAAVSLRRALYDAELLPVTALPSVVVSVGNIEVGGTGKTPVTIWLAKRLAGRGRSVAVVARDLSRGSGGPRRIRTGSTGGRKPSDEVMLLAAKLEDTCAVFAGRSKADAARRAVDEVRPDVVVVDDGLQHLRLARDLDVVVCAFSHPLGRGGLLPAGTLREPPSALSRADWLWISGVPPGRSSEWVRRRLSEHNWKAGRVESTTIVRGFTGSDGRPASPERGGALAFCGIGRPSGFYDTLEGFGTDVVDKVTYPDHHRYTPGDLRRLSARARSAGADWMVTTEKDMVKLGEHLPADLKVLALSVSLEVSGGRALLSQIDGLCQRRRLETADD
jgi:tetraacyldisaccharide 4'-kinase